MERMFSRSLGLGLAMLTLSGFAQRQQPKRFMGVMNVDTQHSVLRVPLTVALLYAGSRQAPLKNTRVILSFVGVFYLAMGAAGLVDKSVGGTLPSKLTRFDVGYHFGVGALALWLGSRNGRMLKQ
jgi:hypothetical protein